MFGSKMFNSEGANPEPEVVVAYLDCYNSLTVYHPELKRIISENLF